MHFRSSSTLNCQRNSPYPPFNWILLRPQLFSGQYRNVKMKNVPLVYKTVIVTVTMINTKTLTQLKCARVAVYEFYQISSPSPTTLANIVSLRHVYC